MIVADFTGKLMPNEETAAVHVLVFLRNNYQEIFSGDLICHSGVLG